MLGRPKSTPIFPTMFQQVERAAWVHDLTTALRWSDVAIQASKVCAVFPTKQGRVRACDSPSLAFEVLPPARSFDVWKFSGLISPRQRSMSDGTVLLFGRRIHAAQLGGRGCGCGGGKGKAMPFFVCAATGCGLPVSSGNHPLTNETWRCLGEMRSGSLDARGFCGLE